MLQNDHTSTSQKNPAADPEVDPAAEPGEDSQLLESLKRLASGGGELGRFIIENCFLDDGETLRDEGDIFDAFRRRASDGDPIIQYSLGVLFHAQGESEAAADMFRLSAEQGFLPAQRSLVDIFFKGTGVQRDIPKAIEWCRKAAEQGDLRCQVMLAHFLCDYDGLGSPEEAAEWFRKAAEQGDAYAQYRLGWLYREGWGVAANPDESARWLLASAEQGYPEAQFSIGMCYRDGVGVSVDFAKCFEWLEKAAEQDLPDAAYELAEVCAAGLGKPQDYNLAAEWFLRADSLGYEGAVDRYHECMAASRGGKG